MSLTATLLFLGAVMASQSGCRQHVPSGYPADPGTFSSEAGTQAPSDEVMLPFLLPADSLSELYEGLHQQASLLEFYRAMEYRPVWFANGERTKAGDSLYSLVESVRYLGLLPQNYHARDLSLFRSGVAMEQALRHDVLLTDAFLTLLRDLRSGRLQSQGVPLDSLHRLLLTDVVSGGNVEGSLRSQEPLWPAYHALKGALHHLLDTCGPADRHLLISGVTLDSIALHRKVQAIELNMDRWRWERTPPEERYLLVNVPAFLARVFERDSVILESRVIVGTPQKPTPRLSSRIECFVTYPYWHVPRRIAVEELLPAIQEDPTYIRRNNFDVLDRKGSLQNTDSINWKAYDRDNFPFVLRQREGVDNSLGVLKFVFDNRFGVYLHDTNARLLFQRQSRAFSHGCIRMEKAVDFAHYLVTGQVGDISPVLQQYLKQKTKHTVELSEPMPIHVRYFTAEVSDNQLHVYPDIYRKDAALIRRLYSPTDEARQEGSN